MADNAEDRKNKYASQHFDKPSKKEVDDYINMVFDMTTLNMICRYVISTNSQVHRSQLINIKTFMDKADPKQFGDDYEKIKRIEFINRALDARLAYNLNDKDMILKHINGGLLDEDFMNYANIGELDASEMNWVGETVSKGLKYFHIFNNADKMYDVCLRIKTADFSNKSALVKEFEDLTNNIQNEFRKCRHKDTTEVEFGLEEDEFNSSIHDVYQEVMNPSRRLITGMQGLNEMLGGGFESGRVYVFFGLPGEGKSLTLLNLMYQVKKYNKSYKTKDPTKRPCVVLLTMENTVKESVERLYDVVSSGDDMSNHTEDEIKNDFKIKGELYLSPDSPIDIRIKYQPTNSVDTSYLYTLVDDYADQGLEVIGIFMDYLGRIRAENHNIENRLELGNVADEFKVFAAAKDIPVITAHQLNRDASKHIDEARQKNEHDLVRKLGRSNISDSIQILNNVDGAFSITPEYPQKGGKYLGVQKMKLRAKNKSKDNLDFVYLPYTSPFSARMVEDVGCATPSYEVSLKPQDGQCMQRRSQFQMNAIPVIDQEFDINPDSDYVFNPSGTIKSSSIADLTAAFGKPVFNPIKFFNDEKIIHPIEFF